MRRDLRAVQLTGQMPPDHELTDAERSIILCAASLRWPGTTARAEFGICGMPNFVCATTQSVRFTAVDSPLRAGVRAQRRTLYSARHSTI